MSIFTKPTVRVEPADGDSGAIEAKLMPGGMIRLQTDPDSMHTHTTWLTPAEIRELCTDLLGLADASEAIHS